MEKKRNRVTWIQIAYGLETRCNTENFEIDNRVNEVCHIDTKIYSYLRDDKDKNTKVKRTKKCIIK